MFVFNKDSNSVEPLERNSFTELKLTERGHLQEWIAKFPSFLGEDLLIIQKEFDGWSETRERLDLLAIDKQGNLVVIENKLDDSGKDVVWQALKYAAYCSTLDNQQIFSIFQKYLGATSDVEGIISDFVEEDLSEFNLNEGSSQRLLLTGANFRPEVTSTCLWLRDRGIDIKCIRVTPFSSNGTIFLNVDQIIPPPEAEEFMVKVGKKKIAEQQTKGELKTRHKLRLEFFELLLAKIDGDAKTLFSNRSPGKDHWLSGATGLSGVNHNFHFLKDRIRYELYVGGSDREKNKLVYDDLVQNKDSIEKIFGAELIWRRLDEGKASRVFHPKFIDAYDKENWPEAIEWLNAQMNLAIKSIQPHLDSCKTKIKST